MSIEPNEARGGNGRRRRAPSAVPSLDPRVNNFVDLIDVEQVGEISEDDEVSVPSESSAERRGYAEIERTRRQREIESQLRDRERQEETERRQRERQERHQQRIVRIAFDESKRPIVARGKNVATAMHVPDPDPGPRTAPDRPTCP